MAQFVGLVHDQPDEQSAIAKAIEEFKVPANQHGRLIGSWAASMRSVPATTRLKWHQKNTVVFIRLDVRF